jgi:hypothetical protein
VHARAKGGKPPKTKLIIIIGLTPPFTVTNDNHFAVKDFVAGPERKTYFSLMMKARYTMLLSM